MSPAGITGRCRRRRLPRDPHPAPARQEPEHARGLGRRPHRRQPAALGAVPRRADDRGDERDRASTSTRSATTSSTRARRSCCGCSTAAATRSTAAPTGTASTVPTSGSSRRTSSAETPGEPLFPPYAIRKFGDIKVGFIGMTLEGTPNIVVPSGDPGLEFLDEAETVNRYAAELHEHGVRAIVVLLHEGGPRRRSRASTPATSPGRSSTSSTARRRGRPVRHRPHAPAATTALIDGQPVTSASSFGRVVTDIDFTLDRGRKDIRT